MRGTAEATDNRGLLLRTVVSLEPHDTLMESMRIALKLLKRHGRAEQQSCGCRSEAYSSRFWVHDLE